MPDNPANPTPDEVLAMLRGDGYPLMFVEFAVQIAASPEIIERALRFVTDRETPPNPLPDTPAGKQWPRLYRRHRAIQNGFWASFDAGEEIDGSQVLDAMRGPLDEGEVAAEVGKMTPEELHAMLAPFLGVPFPPDEPTLRAMLRELDAEGSGGADDWPGFDDLADSPAGQFYFRVWMPCWVLYRDYPPRLMRAARLGDLDALDRLLRLDKFAIGDPGIARRVGEVMSKGTANDKRRMEQALSGRPTVRITPKAIRAGLAALIAQFATLFGCSITAPQIAELFDRIERIRSGNPADPHIPAGESLTKAIKRHKTWPGLPTD